MRFPKHGADSSAQDARTTRGLIEGADYQFLPDRPGVWLCQSVSGHTYRVSAECCTCADWQYRCRPLDCCCKHQVALGHKMIADGAELVNEGLALAKKQQAAEEAAFDRIFG